MIYKTLNKYLAKLKELRKVFSPFAIESWNDHKMRIGVAK